MEENKAFETAAIKMAMLISRRPSAYRSSVWHAAFRIVYFISGLIALIASLYSFIMASAQAVLMETIKNELEKNVAVKAYSEHLFPDPIGYFMPSFIFLFIALLLFILARYCRKIIKRNMYIIQVEDVWEEMKK